MKKIFDTLFKKIKNWKAIGIFLSIVWATGSTFVFFDELKNHISYVSSDRHPRMRVIGYLDEDRFEPKKNTSDKLELSKYTSNFLRYVKQVFLPIFIGWLLACMFYGFIWKQRKEIVEKLIERFEKVDPLIRAFIMIGILLIYRFLYSLGWQFDDILIVFGSLLFLIPITWFLIKTIIYELVYTVIEAFKDASAERAHSYKRQDKDE